MNLGATFSSDRKYRYMLYRNWGKRPDLCWVMLNPSTADECRDDPTIRKCIGYTMNWGYGGLVILNLFAYRSTNPTSLLDVEDPIGLQNDEHLIEMTAGRDTVVAWGVVPKRLQDRPQRVLDFLPRYARKILCLSRTAAGHPHHPLYLKSSLRAIPWATR